MSACSAKGSVSANKEKMCQTDVRVYANIRKTTQTLRQTRGCYVRPYVCLRAQKSHNSHIFGFVHCTRFSFVLFCSPFGGERTRLCFWVRSSNRLKGNAQMCGATHHQTNICIYDFQPLPLWRAEWLRQEAGKSSLNSAAWNRNSVQPSQQMPSVLLWALLSCFFFIVYSRLSRGLLSQLRKLSSTQ